MRAGYVTLGERMMTTQTAVEQQQDLANCIELYLLRCQVEGKSPSTISA
jgi:hypothetical protein